MVAAERAAAATPLAIAPGERVVWLRTTSIHPQRRSVIALDVVALAVAAFGAWLDGAPDGVVWLLILVTIVAGGPRRDDLAFHVRVDDAGLTVRSVLGIPRFRVPLREIDRRIDRSTSTRWASSAAGAAAERRTGASAIVLRDR